VAPDAKVDLALTLLLLLHPALVIVPAINAEANIITVVPVRIIVAPDAKVDLALALLLLPLPLFHPPAVDLSQPRITALLMARKENAFRALVVQKVNHLADMGLLL